MLHALATLHLISDPQRHWAATGQSHALAGILSMLSALNCQVFTQMPLPLRNVHQPPLFLFHWGTLPMCSYIFVLEFPNPCIFSPLYAHLLTAYYSHIITQLSTHLNIDRWPWPCLASCSCCPVFKILSGKDWALSKCLMNVYKWDCLISSHTFPTKWSHLSYHRRKCVIKYNFLHLLWFPRKPTASRELFIQSNQVVFY